MITIKNKIQLQHMQDAGKIVRDVLLMLEENIKEGVATIELDELAKKFIKKNNAIPSFLNYNGFPAAVCVSINDEVVHGIPSKKKIIKSGDIVSIDIGAIYNGYHGDAARTVGVGIISDENKKLIDVCRQSFFEGVNILKDGVRLGDLASQIQTYVEKNNFSVVKSLVGHGIGKEMHESPDVPNYGKAGHGLRLIEGMTIAIEPMINVGTYDVYVDKLDGWTVRTADGKYSAHYENTVAITKDGFEIFTL